MKNTTAAQSCSHELLARSLEDTLPEQIELQLLEHLSGCSDCQQELERLAAVKSEWSRVEEVLRSESAADDDRGADSGVVVSAPAHEDTLADFAVDFLAPSRTDESLGRVDGIEILEVIGRGGMGVVLKGFEKELNRPVVVKMLAPHLASSGAARKRFAREAQATAVIVHPNVMPILTVNSAARLPYLVMPYMACESLQDRIDREGALETLDILRIAHQIACGLAAAHVQGLVHRDVKPANILLERGVDRVMLTDFGLARAADDASLTRTGVIAGTPQFMSPEQARGDSVDARSDLFCLGSVIYVLCAGRPPFRAETSYGVLRRITDEEPRPLRELNPSLPDWLASIVGRLHAKDPADRFQTAEEVAELLERCVAHVQQPDAVSLPETLTATAALRRHRQSSFLPATTGRRTVVASAVAMLGLVIALFVNSRGDTGASAIPAQSESSPRGVHDLEPAAQEVIRHSDQAANVLESTALDDSWSGSVGAQLLEVQAASEELQVEADRLWETRPRKVE